MMTGQRFIPPQPYFAPMAVQVMPPQTLNQLIRQYTQRFTWMKSHVCPCTFSNADQPGSPVPECNTCQGRAYYWDQPSSEFMGALTYVHVSPTPDEAGQTLNTAFGLAEQSQPLLTIPYDADAAGTIWSQASAFDAFVAIDSTTRYDVSLTVGNVEAVPYQQNLTIPPTGAVTVWNTATSGVVVGVSYTVSGASVTLPPQYGPGTSYVVTFTASPVFVAFREAGGRPHVRPFGGEPSHYPRRFRLQELDRWTRANQSFPNSTSPQSLGAGVPIL